jgi:hypothetical protein
VRAEQARRLAESRPPCRDRTIVNRFDGEGHLNQRARSSLQTMDGDVMRRASASDYLTIFAGVVCSAFDATLPAASGAGARFAEPHDRGAASDRTDGACYRRDGRGRVVSDRPRAVVAGSCALRQPPRRGRRLAWVVGTRRPTSASLEPERLSEVPRTVRQRWQKRTWRST